MQENSVVLGAQHKTRKVQSFIIIQGKSKIVITENLVKNYTAKSREKPPDPDLKISNRPKQGKNNPKCFFEWIFIVKQKKADHKGNSKLAKTGKYIPRGQITNITYILT